MRKGGSERSTLLVEQQHVEFSFLSILGWVGKTNSHSRRSRAQLRAHKWSLPVLPSPSCCS